MIRKGFFWGGIAALVICGAVGAGSSARAGSDNGDIYRAMAVELIAGIKQMEQPATGSDKIDQALLYLQKAYDYVRNKRVRVAVWPFNGADVPMSSEAAEDFNEGLYAALLTENAGRFDFVVRSELTALIDDMEQTGALDEAAENPLAALMENARKIDVLIRGRLRLKDGKVSLTYKAVNVDGRVIAATSPRIVQTGAIERKSVTLVRAVKEAARALADGAPDLNELRLGGIRFQDSGAQPAFGRRFLELLASEIAGLSNDVVTGQPLKVTNLRAPIARGVSVTGKELADHKLGGKPGSYLLSGTYWDIGDEIEIRVALRDVSGRTIPWVGRIDRRDAGTTPIRPASNLAPLRDEDGGPLAFHLLSDRGRDPAYRLGEKMNLLIRVGRPAWVYCFYLQADGTAIQLLPNPHFWKNLTEPLLAAGVLHKVPGEATFPFDFVMTEPVGTELIKCFATSRDVTDNLPAHLRGRSLSPLPKGAIANLSSIFRALPDTTISEQSLAVTVSR